MKIVIGSKNEGKIKEYIELLNSFNIDCYTLHDFDEMEEPVESGTTFLENAKIKALYYYNKTKLPVLCDDTGLCIDSLNGEPGVYSARYSKTDKEEATPKKNIQKVLALLKDKENRDAHFTCVICFYDGKDFIIGTGSIYGKIAEIESGTGGFGYDSIFIPDGYDKSFAELGSEIKNNISHRHNALIEFLGRFSEYIEK